MSHEIPAIHAIYGIETLDGVDNHTLEFAEVCRYLYVKVTQQAAKSTQAHHKTIESSKALACVAIDVLSDPRFRDEVRRFGRGEHIRELI